MISCSKRGDGAEGDFVTACVQAEDIASNDLKTVLKAFGQADGALTRRCKGVGLGLSLTKKRVELQGGILDLKSQIGVGTEVVVRFPKDRVHHA